MNLTNEIIMAGTGCTLDAAKAWLAPLRTACAKFNITSSQAVSSFLGNIGVESASLTVFVENLNYSAQGLANTWPTRYAVNSNVRPYAPNALANALARKPQAIANSVYANRLGNGDAGSNDGWRYRGQGPMQLTGHDALARCGAAIGVNLLAHPELLTEPVAGALSAAWYFADRGCIAAANTGNFAFVVKLINGAYPNAANNGDLRESRRKAAIELIIAQ